MHINFFHNSLLLKFPYTYFGGLNHHLQGVVKIIMHRPYSYYICGYIRICTEYTQKNGAVYYVFSIETAPFVCVYPVYYLHNQHITPKCN
jgi:hypothetical protein